MVWSQTVVRSCCVEIAPKLPVSNADWNLLKLLNVFVGHTCGFTWLVFEVEHLVLYYRLKLPFKLFNYLFCLFWLFRLNVSRKLLQQVYEVRNTPACCWNHFFSMFQNVTLNMFSHKYTYKHLKALMYQQLHVLKVYSLCLYGPSTLFKACERLNGYDFRFCSGTVQFPSAR